MPNKQDTATIYTVWVDFSEGASRPVLVTATVKVTPKQVRILDSNGKAYRAFGYRNTVPRGEVHFTLKGALEAWRAECKAQIESAEQELADARALAAAPIQGVSESEEEADS